VDVVDTHRKLNTPLGNIKLDWRYWRDNDWNSHRFDKTRLPDPKAMIDAVYGDNTNFMISVWPKFHPTTDACKELAAKGPLYQGNLRQGNKDRKRPGYANTFWAGRGLPADMMARKIDDQYLFGKAFLVAPVTDHKARSRSVYFPGGTIWYDFSTGKSYAGGSSSTVPAPLERMPLFVRAGSIVPMGPVTLGA
jgi:alpha-glucosidase (family GH31 glycosyl hydrolase)